MLTFLFALQVSVHQSTKRDSQEAKKRLAESITVAANEYKDEASKAALQAAAKTLEER